ncbi:hypothetical protein XA68_12003 [Ophiocordyceps unilateralis]|uniref:Uncharacterized protein n=1 Tax=Ophiocordyceps unilateralis TaxID=268505 RepID=A0A2A9PPH3_OPHUN|nr:hypothetical protein XA68_12003 [Ophiocordyceps unilateralis]
MKFLALTIAALASVVAASYEKECEPATYACSNEMGKPGWKVCNTSGKWEFAGYYPPKTHYEFNKENGSPYCLPDYWKKEY